MNRQAGSLLLEYMVVVVLLSGLAVWSVEHMQRSMREQMLLSGATWSLQVREAVQDYLHRLTQARLTRVDWQRDWPYADWRQPQLHELQEQGLLSSHFPLHSSLGTVIPFIAESSDCHEASCRLDAVLVFQVPTALSWISQPHYQSVWKLRSDGYGVVASDTAQGFFGPGGQWPNPPQGGARFPEGTIGLSVFKKNSRQDLFLSVGDPRDPAFSGQLTVAQSISSKQDVHAANALHIGGVGRYQAQCPTELAIVHDADLPALLVCKRGRWDRIGASHGGVYSTHSAYTCRNTPVQFGLPNPLTGGCSCPDGFSAVLIAEHPQGNGIRRTYSCVR